MSLTKVSNRMIQNAPINVVDYGADPTGVTVCSTEVQAAIDAGAGSNAIYSLQSHSAKRYNFNWQWMA